MCSSLGQLLIHTASGRQKLGNRWNVVDRGDWTHQHKCTISLLGKETGRVRPMPGGSWYSLLTLIDCSIYLTLALPGLGGMGGRAVRALDSSSTGPGFDSRIDSGHL